MPENVDRRTVEGFGREWSRFDQSELGEEEALEIFESYFAVFPWNRIGPTSVGFDLGCGSGRWARLVAPRVGHLHCIDASTEAIKVARTNLASVPGCEFHLADVGRLPLAPDSMDFGYSLGVLHHVPDPLGGIRSATALLKRGAPFLVYLYYALDDRPRWFRWLWRISDVLRGGISNLPFKLKVALTTGIAVLVYLPLARLSWIAEKFGAKVDRIPLSFYRKRSFYVMRTDALDRFGTKLERRFTRDEIKNMLISAGLTDVVFSDRPPFWCAAGIKA